MKRVAHVVAAMSLLSHWVVIYHVWHHITINNVSSVSLKQFLFPSIHNALFCNHFPFQILMFVYENHICNLHQNFFFFN